MTKTIQVRVDEVLKTASDDLFTKLGLDTSTAIRIFLSISVAQGGFPFEIKIPNSSVLEAMDDVLNQKNLSRPYTNAKEAIKAMLEE